MKNILEYKGYYTKVEFSLEDKVLYGKIEGINDLVNFESNSAEDIENEFHDAVDDYLEFCKEVGKEPDKVYKGSFNVRISPALHKEISLLALKNGESLNQTVEKALKEYTEKTTQTEIVLRKKINALFKEVSERSSCKAEPQMFYIWNGSNKSVKMNYSNS